MNITTVNFHGAELTDPVAAHLEFSRFETAALRLLAIIAAGRRMGNAPALLAIAVSDEAWTKFLGRLEEGPEHAPHPQSDER